MTDTAWIEEALAKQRENAEWVRDYLTVGTMDGLSAVNINADRLVLLDHADSLAAALREAQDALEQIAAQQPKTLETLRRHGIVFDGPLGNDPKNWQHVAFSIYTDLCEVDVIARAALAVSPPADEAKP